MPPIIVMADRPTDIVMLSDRISVADLACEHFLGKDAGVKLSAQALRHTFLTVLVRKGTDLVLVAELAGHRRFETTRRYRLSISNQRSFVRLALHAVRAPGRPSRRGRQWAGYMLDAVDSGAS